MRFAFIKVISVLFLVLLINDKAEAGSLNYEVFAISHYAPYVESPCYNNYSYLSTCNNTNPAYVGTSQGTGTIDSLNYNWNSGNIVLNNNNYGGNQRMVVITGYWQHPGTTGQTSTVYFAGRNDDGLIVNINNTKVISDWAQQGPRYWNSNGSFSGVGGQWYPIQINWYEWTGSANMDIHYSLSNLSLNSTSGWLDMDNNHFALTLSVLSGITSSQQTTVTNTKNTTSTTNNIYITQSGAGIDLDILQDGDNNAVIGTNLSSAATISGDNIDVDIAQYGNNNILGIDISGNSNDIDIWQDQNQRAIVDVNGASNTLNLKQEHGSNNNGAHFGDIDIDGTNNILSLWQKGTGDKILFVDIGNSNNVTTVQQGTGEHFLDINLGDSHTVNVNQDGSGNHNAYLNLTGNSSSLTLTQDSSTAQNYHLDQNCTTPSCSATVTQN